MAGVKWPNIVEAAAHNDTDAVKYFLEVKHVPITTCNADEQTAAHIALDNGNLALLKYLVNRDPSIVTATDNKARNIFIQAVDQGALNAIKFLIEERDEDVEREHNLYYGNTAVHMAALRNQTEILKYFLEDRGIDVNVKSDFGETPLFLAVERANMPIVRYLVEKRKARLTLTDKNNNNILYISARRGDLNVPRYVLDELRKNIDLNFRDYFGETILHRAVKFNHLHFIKYLVDEKRVNVNLPDDDGRLPLHNAAEMGNVTIVKYLCENGAFTHVKNDYNQTALDATKDPGVVEYLTEFMSKSDRVRRSVIVSDSLFASYGWGEKIAAALPSWSERSGNDLIVSAHGGISFQLSNVLTFIGVWLRYSAASPFTLLSPLEALQTRMDLNAVNAIEDGFHDSRDVDFGN